MTRKEQELPDSIDRKKRALYWLASLSKIGGIVIIVVLYIILALFMQALVLGYY